MADRIKVFLVDKSDQFVDKIEDYFIHKQSIGIDIVGKATTKNTFFYNKQAIIDADLFIIPASLPDGSGLELIDYIQENESIKHKPILFTVDKQSSSQVAPANEKEVDRIMQKPISLKELIKCIYDLGSSKDQIKQPEESPKKEPKSKNQYTSFEEEEIFDEIEQKYILDHKKKQLESDPDRIPKGMYTFISPNSSGKTSLLVNTAVALREKSSRKPSVCIVDLNLFNPEAALFFREDELSQAKKDIYDISADLAYMNEELISHALIKHGPTGIFLLNTPGDINSIQKIPLLKNDQIEKILTQLKKMFDIVLVDTSSQIADSKTLIPLQFSDRIFAVLLPEFFSFVSMNKTFYIIKQYEETIDETLLAKTDIVLNRESKINQVDEEIVKRFLENKTFLTRIPYDENYITYVNKGDFFIHTNSPISTSLLEIAQRILPIELDVNEKRKTKKFKFF